MSETLREGLTALVDDAFEEQEQRRRQGYDLGAVVPATHLRALLAATAPTPDDYPELTYALDHQTGWRCNDTSPHPRHWWTTTTRTTHPCAGVPAPTPDEVGLVEGHLCPDCGTRLEASDWCEKCRWSL